MPIQLQYHVAADDPSKCQKNKLYEDSGVPQKQIQIGNTEILDIREKDKMQYTYLDSNCECSDCMKLENSVECMHPALYVN